ncbi:DNA polymerase III subunit gamma/tau [Candidatus Berkiella cookevillensis]|uniref:DNA polymerase III subunit gamma/tau n=1 Tax=Candidatus Berkiella cookevillensis TaxID=437022 RepID=A0A0Q9YHN3_9GAMM|nr:DNA polymerase III subunit gamma/tau [Candidatus Berkiella cookevillensis]MCS5707725.1 DNA polymerase III subunit gamma/tau [Candidatus Berkiella cookevillensis]
MSYSALARKWRPKSFAELKGQDHVAKALMNALARNQLHHAYLFTGTRGIGKTTIARIFAKCLNCEQGVVATPCNACDTCRAIDSGRYLDLIEVDAASKTKVEDTRELLDNVQYAPAAGRYKVYLIDEVHMLSGHSFNALLKTLEEPPSHVKFILATTDPEKIPVTILSRCLNFQLRALSENEISQQLALILQQESKSYEAEALQLLACFAKGSMRDALSLLEQAVSYCQDENINLQDVEFMLGMQYRQYLIPLLQAVFEQNIENAVALVQKMMDIGADAESVLQAFLESLHELSMQSIFLKKESALHSNKYQNLTIPLPEVLQLLYQIGLNGKRDLLFAPNTRIGLEMTILRMIAFLPDERKLGTPVTRVSTQQHATTPMSKPVTKPSQDNRASSKSFSSAVPPPALSSPRVEAQQARQQVEAKEVSAPAKALTANQSWNDIIEGLPLTGLTRILVKNCTVSHWGERSIHLALDISQEACLNQSRQMQIQKALSDYLGKDIVLKISCAEHKGTVSTPLQQDQQKEEQAQTDAKALLLNDERVQTIMQTFDATIENVSYEKVVK